MPDRPVVLQITTEARSLLATWTYSNPPLAQGAVINGYRIYITSSNYSLNHMTTALQLSVTRLVPFTNYTVEVSAFNTRGDGTVQEGPRSDPTTETTLGEYMYIASTGQRVRFRLRVFVYITWRTHDIPFTYPYYRFYVVSQVGWISYTDFVQDLWTIIL